MMILLILSCIPCRNISSISNLGDLESSCSFPKNDQNVDLLYPPPITRSPHNSTSYTKNVRWMHGRWAVFCSKYWGFHSRCTSTFGCHHTNIPKRLHWLNLLLEKILPPETPLFISTWAKEHLLISMNSPLFPQVSKRMESGENTPTGIYVKRITILYQSLSNGSNCITSICWHHGKIKITAWDFGTHRGPNINICSSTNICTHKS